MLSFLNAGLFKRDGSKAKPEKVWGVCRDSVVFYERRPAGARQVSKVSEIWDALVHNIFGRSQRNFAHVTTVALSCRMKNVVAIGGPIKPEHCKLWSNFEFDRNTLVERAPGWHDGSVTKPVQKQIRKVFRNIVVSCEHKSGWHSGVCCLRDELNHYWF